MNVPLHRAAPSRGAGSAAQHHLLYRSPDQAAADLEGQPEGWRHTAGAQLKRVATGDVVWVVSFVARRPILLARIPADHVVDSTEAKRMLGDDRLPTGKWHVVADAGHAQPPSLVEFADLVPDLPLEGPALRLPPDVNDNNLRTLCTLTPEGARLIETRWAERDHWQAGSRAAAEAVVARILPDAARRRWLLGWFAHAIDAAHELAPDKWGVVLLPDRARLYVCFTIVCTLYQDRIWMYVNRHVLSTAESAVLSAEPGWEWDADMSEATGQGGGHGSGYLSSVDDEEAAATILQGALSRRIADAARRGGLRASTKAAWADGLIQGVEAALGRALPRPSWVDEAPSEGT